MLQKLPQGAGVVLHPVGGGDHQNGVVQKGQHPLGLGGEVHVAGGVQEDEITGLGGEPRLLGEDGDAPLPLHGIGIQIGVSVIHTAL